MLRTAWHAPDRPLTIACAGCALAALVLVSLLLAAFAVRVPFPFELEWMEGATVVHVDRLLGGHGMYVRPSIDFVPFAYPPLYYVAALPVAWLLGPGFLSVRLVSALASLATLAAVFSIVRRESGRVPAVVAAGTFAGAYPLSDGWLDLGRVDALYVALLALTWLLAARARTQGQWALAGAAGWLAFMTKQPALPALLPLCVYLLAADRRAAGAFAGALLLPAAASVLALDALTDGWYRYYVFELPRMRMAVSAEGARALGFWTHDLLRPLPIALALGIVGVAALRRWREAALAAGCIATAWLARLEGGAWSNAVLPAYLAVSVLFGLALQRLGRWQTPVLAAAALQLALLFYDPRPWLPTARDRAAGDAVVAALRAATPPLLVVDHSWWATLAGRREHAHGWAVTDVVWADRHRAGPALEREIREALRTRRFRTVIVDRGRSWFLRDVEESYRRAGRLVDGEGYRPRSGAPRRPELVYIADP